MRERTIEGAPQCTNGLHSAVWAFMKSHKMLSIRNWKRETYIQRYIRLCIAMHCYVRNAHENAEGWSLMLFA